MNSLTPEASALNSLVTEIIVNSAMKNLTVYDKGVISKLVGEMPLEAKSIGALALVCQALPVMPIEEGGIWPQVAGQVCQTMIAGRDSRAVLLREYFERHLSHGSAGIGGETHLSWRLSRDEQDWRRADALRDLSISGVVKKAQIGKLKYVTYELAESVIAVFGNAFAAAAFGLTGGMEDSGLEKAKPEIAKLVHPGWFLD